MDKKNQQQGNIDEWHANWMHYWSLNTKTLSMLNEYCIRETSTMQIHVLERGQVNR